MRGAAASGGLRLRIPFIGAALLLSLPPSLRASSSVLLLGHWLFHGGPSLIHTPIINRDVSVSSQSHLRSGPNDELI